MVRDGPEPHAVVRLDVRQGPGKLVPRSDPHVTQVPRIVGRAVVRLPAKLEPGPDALGQAVAEARETAGVFALVLVPAVHRAAEGPVGPDRAVEVQGGLAPRNQVVAGPVASLVVASVQFPAPPDGFEAAAHAGDYVLEPVGILLPAGPPHHVEPPAVGAAVREQEDSVLACLG